MKFAIKYESFSKEKCLDKVVNIVEKDNIVDALTEALTTISSMRGNSASAPEQERVIVETVILLT